MDSNQRIYFSKDFWNYFIRTHPQTTASIFIGPLHDAGNNYITLPDDSYSFYYVTRNSSFSAGKLLADSITGHEKSNRYGRAFFIVPDDKTGETAKNKRIEQRLKNYQITPGVKQEFERLKAILLMQDSSAHYIIVFKKRFTDAIYKLYQ